MGNGFFQMAATGRKDSDEAFSETVCSGVSVANSIRISTTKELLYILAPLNLIKHQETN